MEPYWNQIKQIINESDIVLEILDARAIDISRNEQIESLIADAGRPRIFVINKADLVSKQDLESSAEKLSRDRNAEKDSIVYFSNKWKSRTVKILIAKIKQTFKKHGKRKGYFKSPILKRPYREAKGDIIIGVVGYPNVGKSSIINALAFKKKTKITSRAGTTHGVHWISTGKDKEIKLIDTPGVIPLSYQDEANLGIIAAKNPEKIKDPETVAGKIIGMFYQAGKKAKFEKFYDFKISEENSDNPYLILEELAIAKRHLRKGGLPDDMRTSVMVLKDWQTGKLKL